MEPTRRVKIRRECLGRVRPYKNRTLQARGVRHPWNVKNWHSMAHVETGGRLLCGFSDFDGLELDGFYGTFNNPGPGYAANECDDCAWFAETAEEEREEFDRWADNLPAHLTEEMER
ncbi:MAG: hypothetical protein O7A04_03820 [Acidobacteria bacterium]|nr:hypothetical protein [Acidobacteriota bacterium]